MALSEPGHAQPRAHPAVRGQTAPLAAKMWTKLTGQTLNGVIALDVAGVQQLSARHRTGGGQWADDQLRQRRAVPAPRPVRRTDRQPGRRRRSSGRTGWLAGAVLQQLQGQTADLNALAKAVTGAVSGRHLMVWSKNPVDQAAWVGERGQREPHLPLRRRLADQPECEQARPVRTDPGGGDHGSGRGGHRGHHDHQTEQHHTGRTVAVHRRAPTRVHPFPTAPTPALVAATSRGRPATSPSPAPARRGHGVRRDRPGWWPRRLVMPRVSPPHVVFHFTMPGRHGSMTVVPSARIPAEQWTARRKTFDDTARSPSGESTSPSGTDRPTGTGRERATLS